MALSASEGQLPTPPLIGLTTYVEQARHGSWDERVALVPDTYLRAISQAGGCPVLLPPAPAPAQTVLSVLDGLVLIGGADLGPANYGADPHPHTDPPEEERDAWELALCRGALADDLALLAVCRGMQVLNVALGGTLHQHLPDVLGHDAHRGMPGEMSANALTLTPGTALAAALGSQTVGQCCHHQSLDRLGSGLGAVGFAADGTIEAVEVAGRSFAVGVQWHPEDTEGHSPVFVALVRAAELRRAARSAKMPTLASTPLA